MAGLAVVASCASPLGDGELGTPRMVGFVLGAPPLDAVSPASDRAGNIYVLTGKRTAPDTLAFVLRAGGGGAGACRLSKGDSTGPIGWVGFSQERQWYWSGAALVAMSASGDCKRVLDRDPTTGSDLSFRAIFPWVADRPSRTTVAALVQTPTDPAPFAVLVDLDSNIYTAPRPFTPEGARDVVVHGVGGSATRREGYLVASFSVGDGRRAEARVYDEEGAVLSAAPVGGLEGGEPYSMPGYLQANDKGLVAGVVDATRLLLFDRRGARIVQTEGYEVVGVHSWKGALYAVGKRGGSAVVAPIRDDGSVGGAAPWSASGRIAATLLRPLDVVDDRSPPRRSLRFDAPRAASELPFVTPHTSDVYADGTTLIAIAGPTVGEGLGASTLLAVAPAGVSYP